MSYTLHFDLSPDPIRSGAVGHTSTCEFRMVVNGVETVLGTRTSPPEADPNGIPDWGSRSFDVTAVFNPAAASLYVRWRYSSGSDTGYVRYMRVEDHLGNVWHDQYNAYNDTVAFDGGGSPFQMDPCDLPAVDVNPFGDGFARHVFFPAWECPGSGWTTGSIAIG